MKSHDHPAIVDDPINTETEAGDKPLFALRYRPYKLGLRFLVLMILGPLFGIGLFADFPGPSSLLSELFRRLVFGLGFGLAVYQFVDLLLFREIRLYKNRIVKLRALCRPIEVKLENARLGGLKFLLAGGRRVVSRDAGIISRNFGGLWWEENLVDPEQVKQFNMLLAKLSGRPLEDIKRLYISKQPLIEKEDK